MFYPDHIILGGGVLMNKGFPKEKLNEYIYKHSRKPYPADALDIVYAVPSQENGIVGTAIYGFNKLTD